MEEDPTTYTMLVGMILIVTAIEALLQSRSRAVMVEVCRVAVVPSREMVTATSTDPSLYESSTKSYKFNGSYSSSWKSEKSILK